MFWLDLCVFTVHVLVFQTMQNWSLAPPMTDIQAFSFHCSVTAVWTCPMRVWSWAPPHLSTAAPLPYALLSGSVYLTTVTTCFSFSDTTGTVPGLLCLRTFLSLENKRERAVSDSICWWEYSGREGGRERSANRKEEDTEYETVDLTPTSPTTLMHPENHA